MSEVAESAAVASELDADTQAPPPSENTTEAVETSWRDGVKDEKARAIIERYNTIDDVANGLLAKEQALSQRVALPGDNATEEDLAKFRKAVGVPDSVDDYNIAALKPEHYTPEQWSAESMQATVVPVITAVHKAGASESVVQAMTRSYFELEAKAQAEQDRQDASWADAAEEQLRTDWGSDYKANMAAATSAISRVPGIENMTLKDGSQLGNNPLFIRLAAELGRLQSPDNKTVHQFLSAEQGQDLKQQHADLTRKQYDAMQSGRVDEAKEYDRQRREVSEKINGTKSIRG